MTRQERVAVLRPVRLLAAFLNRAWQMAGRRIAWGSPAATKTAPGEGRGSFPATLLALRSRGSPRKR